MKILLIEDEPPMLSSMKAYLEMERKIRLMNMLSRLSKIRVQK